MDPRQLQILRELGEQGSVSAVAKTLYVTPSAVSQQLRLLQSTIAVPLTRMSGRNLTLTEAGRALAAAAGDVQTALARARAAVEAFTDEPAGPVTVCAFHSGAATFFPALLRTFAGANHSRLELADADVAQADFPALTARYDIVLAHRLDYSPEWPDTVIATPLLHEPLDVALPIGHPLTAKRTVRPVDLIGERWITVHDGFPLLATVTAIGAAAGHAVDIRHRVNDFGVVAELVAAGGGVALLPRWTSRIPPEVALRPLAGVHARRHIDALHRPEHAVRTSVQSALRELKRAAIATRRAG